MDKEKYVGQNEINGIWRKQWDSETQENSARFFSQRLFVEGYPIFRKYIPLGLGDVLDAGGGTGRYGLKIAQDLPNSTVTISDILEEALNIGKNIARENAIKNVHFKKDDILASSFPDNTFDLVFSDVVIQHLPEYRTAIREIKRITKTGGRIIISNNNFWNLHTLYKKLLSLIGMKYEYGYEKSFSRNELKEAMEQEGIKVIATDGFYVGYEIFRLKKHHEVFRFLGRALTRLSKILDKFTGRFFSKTFGFEILVVGQK